MSQPDQVPGEITLTQLEAAINVWRNRTAAAPDDDGLLVLCAEARALADLYGVMIYTRAESVAASTLSAAQATALRVVLA